MPLTTWMYRLAESQGGVVARWQLRGPLPDHVIDGALRGPRFERVAFGVHRVVGSGRPPEESAIAATLRAGRGATLTGPVVLALWQVDGFRGDEPFEVLVPPGRRVRSVDFRTSTDPDPGRSVGRRGAVRMVAPLDALIASAAFVDDIGPRRLRLAHDVLRWRGLIAPGRVQDRLEQLGRRIPCGRGLDQLLEMDGTASTSDGERDLQALLSRFDPPPERQVWVTPLRRVDFYFRALRYAVEYQGVTDHAHAAGRAADRARVTELSRQGIEVGFVTAADLGHPETLLAGLAGRLAARALELRADAPRLRASD